MAVFKCKMCGGALEINGNETVAVCEYCGTKQTLPKLTDDRKANLYDRANHFRRNNEFDKAMSIYESILNEDKTDAESYWSLVLCRYGIEYVEDPASKKRIPTVNRAQYTSIFMDEDYKSAIEYADGFQKDIYEAEAKAIDEIQKGILEISQKEEPFDVFICYKETDSNGRRTPDSVLATELYHELCKEGFKVFFSRITLEDKLGTAYEPYIFAALNSAKVMVVLGTKQEYFNAVWVKNEWSRYLALIKNGARKTLIPAYKDMDPYDLPEEFSHLQAQDMTKLGFMQDLIRGVRKIAGETEKAVVKETSFNNAAVVSVDSLLKRAYMFLEDEEWAKASEYFEKALDNEPETASAYVGIMLVEGRVKTIQEINKKSLIESNNFQRAKKFADDKLIAQLIELENRIKEEENKKLNYIDTLNTLRKKNKPFSKIISAGGALLFSNGQVKAYGDNKEGQCNVSRWKDIVAVASSSLHTVGLKDNGTVVAVGYNEFGQCKLSSWKDIIDVLPVSWRTVGLKKDGTVLEVGSSSDAVYSLEHRHEAGKVKNWRNIVAIAAGDNHTVGLKSDGTVVSVGSNYYGQCKTANWKHIVDVSASDYHTVGLKFNGTVIATGNNDKGQCNVNGWKDIIAVSAGDYHTVGLKADGTVVAVGDSYNGGCDVNNWKDIIAVSASSWYTMGLKKDGTIITTGKNDYSGIKLFDSYDNFINERTEKIRRLKEKRLEKQKAEQERLEQERIAEQRRLDKMKEYRDKGLCQYCGGLFKGFFKRICSNCGKEKDY